MIIIPTPQTLLQHHDFGKYEGMLEAIAAGEKKTEMLADILEEYTDLGWVSAGESDYSVASAKVVYCGANNEFLPTCSLFEKVLILELSTSSKAISGKVYLQMNRAERSNENV